MTTATNLLVQSKYFLPVFNMAIFDGPFRLYFSHIHEAEALRLYFALHETLGKRVHNYRGGDAAALFVLLFPDEASYDNAFDGEFSISRDWLGDNEVIGIRGPNWNDDALNYITSRIDEVFTEIPNRPLEAAAP